MDAAIPTTLIFNFLFLMIL